MGISLQDAQQIDSNAALRTQYGLILPPGARVAAYVRSSGVQQGDDGFLATNLVSTIAAGLARVRSGMGDYVVCLPGHVETVTDATTFSGALVAGAKIIGVGRGSNMPQIVFSAAAAQWLVNKADVVIAGFRISAATINVTLPFQVTAADFGFYNNDVQVSSTFLFVTATIQLQAGADRADISGNVFRGNVNGGSGSVLLVSGVIDAARIADNEINASNTSAAGCISVTAAATALKILRNTINNQTAACVAAISYSNVACTGQCAYNTMTVLSTGAVVAGVTGITVGGTNNLTGYFQNFCVNDPNKSGLLVPAVDA